MEDGCHKIDSISLPFVNEQDKIYETLGAGQKCLSQPSSGLNKQATQQLCTRADGEQNVKPALIFRGKGRVAIEEKEKV